MKKLIGPVGGFIAIIAVLFGGYFYFEDRYAKCAELKQLEQRLDYKILQDLYNGIQQRIWLIKERHGERPKDTTTKEELNKLESDKARVEKKLDVMEKK